MEGDFPPPPSEPERSDFRTAVMEILREKQPIAARAIPKLVREKGVRIKSDRAKELLKKYAADGDDPITYGDDGYRISRRRRDSKEQGCSDWADPYPAPSKERGAGGPGGGPRTDPCFGVRVFS